MPEPTLLSTANIGTTEGLIPALGAGGKLASSLLPSIALTETLSVANAAARLALTSAQAQGKIVIEADTEKSYGLVTAGNPATSGDWLQLGDNTVTAADITDSTAAGRALLTAADAAAQIAALGMETLPISGNVLPLTRRVISTSTQTGSPAPLKICQMILGDSFATGLPLSRSVQPIREFGDFTSTVSGGAVWETNQFALTPSSSAYRMSGAGHIVTSNLSKRTVYKVTCIYSTVAGGGTFALEVRVDGGAWVEVPGATTASPINTDNGGAASAAAFTHTYSNSSPREIRAKWISGTSRILYFVLSDLSTASGGSRGGSAQHNLALGGITIANYATTPDAIWTVFLNVIQPDFLTIKSDDDYTISPISSVYSKLAAIRAMDWIFLSNHPTSGSPTQVLSASDQILKTLAITNGQAFFDCRRALPDYAGIVALGLTTDGYHLNPAGQEVLQTAMMDAAARGLLAGVEMHRTTIRTAPTLFSGTGRFFGENYNAFADLVSVGVFREGTNANPSASWALRIPTANQVAEVAFSDGYVWQLLKNNRRIFSGGTEGLGFTQNITTAFTRDPLAPVEFHSGNLSAAPAAISTRSNFVGDAFFGQRNCSLTAAGTRAWGVNANGDVDFKTMRNNPVTVAALAALVNTTSGSTVEDETMVEGLYYRIVTVGTTNFTTLGASSNTVNLVFLKNANVTYGTGTVIRMIVATGTQSFVTDSSVAHAGNSGNIVAGGGANALPVYYDGTNWRIS